MYCDINLLNIVNISNVIWIHNHRIEFIHRYNKIRIIRRFQKIFVFEMTQAFSFFDDRMQIFGVNIEKILNLHELV